MPKNDIHSLHQKHDGPVPVSIALKHAVDAHQAGRVDEALQMYHSILTQHPHHPEALNFAGVALSQKGDHVQSARLLQLSIAAKPDYAQAYFNLGRTMAELRQFEDSAVAYGRALAINPNYAQAANNLGSAHAALKQFKESVAAFREAIRINPNFVQAIGNLAKRLEMNNSLDEVESLVERGLKLDPNDPLINEVAATCDRRAGRFQEALDRLTRISESEKGQKNKMALHFEFGRIYDRLNNTENAYEHFVAGNLLAQEQSSKQGFYLEKTLKKIGTLSDTVNRSWFESWTQPPPMNEKTSPVFLIGFPRSGTTLLQQILDSHPGVQTLEEKCTLAEVEIAVDGLPGGYPAALATLEPSEIERLRAIYFQAVKQYVDYDPSLTLIDKMPLNTVDVALIQRIFPKAKIILAIRHPCDACLSCFMQLFAFNFAMSNFFSIENTANLYAKVMTLWQQYIEVLPVDYHRVRYEDLVENFQDEVRGLLEYLGVGWDDAVLQYAEHAKNRASPIRTPSYNQVTEPIYKRATNRWRRYEKLLAPVLGTLKPYAEYFGYTC